MTLETKILIEIPGVNDLISSVQNLAGAVHQLIRILNSEAAKTQRADLLTPDQAAYAVGHSPGTLAQWRFHKNHTLPFIKVGGRVFYKIDDVQRFLEAGKLDSHHYRKSKAPVTQAAPNHPKLTLG